MASSPALATAFFPCTDGGAHPAGPCRSASADGGGTSVAQGRAAAAAHAREMEATAVGLREGMRIQ